LQKGQSGALRWGAPFFVVSLIVFLFVVRILFATGSGEDDLSTHGVAASNSKGRCAEAQRPFTVRAEAQFYYSGFVSSFFSFSGFLPFVLSAGLAGGVVAGFAAGCGTGFTAGGATGFTAGWAGGTTGFAAAGGTGLGVG
jgi:hypothetical protein